MFGIKIITNKELNQLRESIVRELKHDTLQIFQQSFKEFTADVVECLKNNFEGFAATLEGKPCSKHNQAIIELQKKYGNHETRIRKLEKEIKEFK
jgi:hypothetical protein